MILAMVGYGLLIGALAALAAWLIERAQVVVGRPRKHAWLGGIGAALLVPVLVMSLREPGDGVVTTLTSVIDIQVRGAANTLAVHEPAASPGGEADGRTLNDWLAALWALGSTVLLARYGLSAWQLERRSRRWRQARVDSALVSVAPDVGPAVFGWRRARVVFPAWLVEAPRSVQCLALAHEREHLAARDPQVLTAATLLAALLPWNLPLIWMLRRLRFAMEVDCDARVIRRGADPNDYGLALLYVSERQSRAPITAIALIGRKSQLEQRIQFMFMSPRKHRALIAGACLALAAGSLFAAAQVQAPAIGAANVVLKPPPEDHAKSLSVRLGQQFELLLRDRYPDLLRGEFTNIPVIVTLLNDDLTIANSARIDSIKDESELNTTPEVFAVLGLTSEQVPYTGAMNVQIAPGTTKRIAMLYTERGRRDWTFVSKLFPDTRQQDRAIFEQEFPAAGDIAAGHDPWLLLDRKGAVLRKGLEPITEEFSAALQARYAGINTQEITVTKLMGGGGEPLRDAGGRVVQLHAIWLAPGSPLPAN